MEGMSPRWRRFPSRVSPSAAPAFTLIELLVVISIVALLIALLLPAIKRAKELSKVVVCMSNTRQIGVVMKSYIADNAGFYPVPPLEKYFSTNGYDFCLVYMKYFYGGDDIGGWGPTSSVPAYDRPLADYLDPYSVVYRCPADNIAAWGGRSAWEGVTTSYVYNAEPWVGYPGLFDVRLEDVVHPKLTVEVGDQPWWTTRPNLPDNDFLNWSTMPERWWHPIPWPQKKASLAFVDGHSDFVPIQMRVANTSEYRRDPYDK